MAAMKHDRYVATIDYDPDIDQFVGQVVNTRDVITFYGHSIDELKREFAKSVEEHLKFCARKGVEPSKPYSGRIPLRLDPSLHRRLDAAAALSGLSLNAYIAETLERETRETE
jgi:predicted HicB family RNase H-like nuclease